MSAFTVMPMSQAISLTGGQVYVGSITVFNPRSAAGDFHYAVEVTPFSITNDRYEPDLTSRSARSMMADWIEVENPTGVLKPNERAEIQFKITVPENAPAGGQYATLSVRSNNPSETTEGANVTSIFELASVIYAQVAGATVHEGEIVSNKIPGFLTNLPLTVSTEVKNTGNVHDTATVALKVSNKITGEVIYPTENDSESFDEMVMPESTRVISREIGGLSELGIYEVSQEVVFLDWKSSNSQTVIICPIWFIVLVSALVVAVIGTIIYKIVRRKRKSVRNFA